MMKRIHMSITDLIDFSQRPDIFETESGQYLTFHDTRLSCHKLQLIRLLLIHRP